LLKNISKFLPRCSEFGEFNALKTTDNVIVTAG